MSIRENIRRVEEKLRAAEERAGRPAGSARLIAVSKIKPVEDMLAAYEAGIRDFGENYVQEVQEKAPQLPEDARIHFIGHLQTNKIGKLMDHVYMIHGVDSLHLAGALERQAAARNRQLPVLLEVNIGGEDSKFGFAPQEVLAAVQEVLLNCPHLRLQGLMTSAPLTEDPEKNRPYFTAMRKLLDSANEMLAEDPEGRFAGAEPLSELSMGMSGDYIPAVEEGATMVRIGTALFGARDYSRK